MSRIIDPRSLPIADYTYDLPEDKIAQYPLPERDTAKLVVYRAGNIRTKQFKDLPELLPPGSLLVLNDAKVVHARLLFKKETGGLIEIFCLEPAAIYSDMTIAMAQKGEVYWQCLVGGAAKWKDGQVLTQKQTDGQVLSASMDARNPDDFRIHFSWSNPESSFAEILEHFGKVPLPPYMNRASKELDESSYQTVFAANEGSVAAPTASLHFTPEVFENLQHGGVEIARLTLHVGAGTFKPVKTSTAGGHSMHAEWIELNEAALVQLIQQANKPIIAAGTTALRTLESLYWLGRKIFYAAVDDEELFSLGQWDSYSLAEKELCTRAEALEAILQWMKAKNTTRFIAKTGIMIAPGYSFKMIDALITNFHQPQSTLLLLVAAFVGNDWKQIYDYALGQNFRFLSYGDANLLWRNS